MLLTVNEDGGPGAAATTQTVSQPVSQCEAVSHFLFTDLIVVIKCTLSHNDRILFNLFITAAPLKLIFKVQPGH